MIQYFTMHEDLPVGSFPYVKEGMMSPADCELVEITNESGTFYVLDSILPNSSLFGRSLPKKKLGAYCVDERPKYNKKTFGDTIIPFNEQTKYNTAYFPPKPFPSKMLSEQLDQQTNSEYPFKFGADIDIAHENMLNYLEPTHHDYLDDIEPFYNYVDDTILIKNYFAGETYQPAHPLLQSEKVVDYSDFLSSKSRSSLPMAELKLAGDFVGLLDGLQLADVAQIPEGANPPKSLGNYDLVPVKNAEEIYSTASSAGYYCEVPNGVTVDYGGVEGSNPFLDSSVAIGLAYKDGLSALASACVTPDNRLKIVQIQAVTGKANDPKTKFKTGLHGGFQWRDSLVEAWIEIAKKLEISEVEIQGARKNRWYREERSQAFEQGYDQVAERMGFTFDEDSGNWRKTITQA